MTVKKREFVALVSSLALLGMVVSAPAYAGDDRSRSSIQLAKPRNLAGTPTATSIRANFSPVANASSYTVRVKQGERTVAGTCSTNVSSCTISGLSPLTKYKITVRAIGNRTTYTDSDESDEVSVNTTARIIHSIRWASACHDSIQCRAASGGSSTYAEGLSIVSIASDPSEPGWTFTGWSSSNSSVAPTPSSTPASPYDNLVFTAQWRANTYNVSWASACHDSTHCTVASGGSSSYTAGQTITPASDPSEPGWTFTGWSSSNSSVAPTPSSTPASPYDNLVFTAQWTAVPTTHMVTWNPMCPSGGVGCEITTTSYTEGQALGGNPPFVHDDNCSLFGWHLENDLTTSVDGNFVPSAPYGDITINATFGGCGGSQGNGGNGGGPTDPGNGGNGGNPTDPGNGGGPTGPLTHTVTWIDNCDGCSGSPRYVMRFNDGDPIGGDPRSVPGTSYAGSFANWVWSVDPTIDVWDLLAMIFHEDVVFEGIWLNM